MGPNRQRKARLPQRGRGRGGQGSRRDGAATRPPPSLLSQAQKDMVLDVLHHAVSGGTVPVPEKHFDGNSGKRITFQRNVPLTPTKTLQKLFEGLGFPPDLITQYISDLVEESRVPSFNSIVELLVEDGPFQAFLTDSCFELFSCMLWAFREEKEINIIAEEGDAILEEELETLRCLFDDSFIGVKNFEDGDTDDRELYFAFPTEDGKDVVVIVRIPDYYPADPPVIIVQPRRRCAGNLPTPAVLPADTKELPTAERRSILDAGVDAINGFVGEGCLVGLLSSVRGVISSINVSNDVASKRPLEVERQKISEEKRELEAKRKGFADALSKVQDYSTSPKEDTSDACILPAKVELSTIKYGEDGDDRIRKEFLTIDETLNKTLKAGWESLRVNGSHQRSREQLPAFQAREELRQAISCNRVVVVSGETGSGKTTQIPQYLYEFMCEEGVGSSANIVCTQPRRLAATSVASRVAKERDDVVGGVTGYTIRLENCVSRRTQITYCTTGIILRRLQVDKFLGRVSHIVVDEIHERGVDTDVLLILLRDLIKHRDDLKIVLMSATMDSVLFAQYFGGAPIISIKGRMFPVQVFHLEDIIPMVNYSPEDSSVYAKKPVRKDERCHNARKRFTCVDSEEIEDMQEQAAEVRSLAKTINASPKTLETISRMNLDVINYELIELIVLHIDTQMLIPGAVLIFLPGMAEIVHCMDQLKSNPRLAGSCVLYNLHSSLGSSDQHGVFQRPPKGKRKVVIGTNIMETSITIDDAVFVVDCGKVKENRYDPKKSLSQLVTVNTSKANCRQRQGRAGRVRDGYCFRLFTSAHYEKLDDHQLCEMHRVPLEGLILQIYSLNLGDEMEYLRKALSPPEECAVRSSVKVLTTLGAITHDKHLTSLGQHMSNLPLDVRISKMVIHGAILQCADPVLTIAACLGVRSPFLSSFEYQTEVEGVRRALAGQNVSDHLVLWFAYAKWASVQYKNGVSEGNKLCEKYYLSLPSLRQIQVTKQQYERYLYEAGLIEDKPTQNAPNCFLYNPVVTLDDHLYESCGAHLNTNSGDIKCILACIVAGLYPNIARVKTIFDGRGEGKRSKITTHDGSEVLVHPSSVAGKEKAFASPLLVYVDKVKTSTTFLREVSMVTPLQVIFFGGGRLEYLPKFGELVIDDTTAFRCQSEDATLLKHLKDQLDSALRQKINDPSKTWESTSSVVVRAILKLLKDESSSAQRFVISDHKQPKGFPTPPVTPCATGASGSEDSMVSGKVHSACYFCGQQDHLERKCPYKLAAAKGGPVTPCFICGAWHHPTECAMAASLS